MTCSLFKIWPHPVPYAEACVYMDETVRKIRSGQEGESIWALEHPSVYTYGSRTSPEELERLRHHTSYPIEPTSRGGKITFHGKGQRVIYPMLDLRHRKISIHEYIDMCTQWMISVLDILGIQGDYHPSHAGIWTSKGKVISMGMRVWQGITFHGLALNMDMDLSLFRNISLCGLPGTTVTSLKEMGCDVSLEKIDSLLQEFCPFLS